jgi:vacuolar-type H+-ATPase subunit H
MKPGSSNDRKRETTEQFAARMGKELREAASRIKEEANTEANRIRSEADKQAKKIRKVASGFDGRRS